MGREEQQEEREVLDSIFPEEITDINDTEYRISMVLDVKPESENPEDETFPTLLLNVRYPDAYPDEAPLLDITQPPNAPKHRYLDVQADKARLLDALRPTIEENMGIAMIFAVHSTLKDGAELLISERQQAKQAAEEVEMRKAEEEENRKFEGEKVTRESFLAWRESFVREIEEEKARLIAEAEAEEKKKRGKVEEKKLTGRQLWEQGLIGKLAAEEEEGEDVIAEGMQRVKVEG